MILDWTAAAMKQRIDQSYAQGDVDRAVMLEGVLELYEAGEMEIAWENGAPMYRFVCDVEPPPEAMQDDW